MNMIKLCMSKLRCRDIKFGFKLFDAMVAPILYYGAEIWGIDKVKDVETVQNKFCKWLLGTGLRMNNHIARSECGRHELYATYMCKPIKYFLRLQSMDNKRLPYLCYRMLFQLNEHGRTNWCTRIQRLLFSYGFGEVWESQGVGDEKLFMNIFKQRLKDVSLQNWSNYISSSTKCSFYSKIKDGIFVHENLQKLSFNLRGEIFSILCSTHKLAIEEGRHLNIPRVNRLCKLCNLNQIEDEYHFLLVCPILSDIRRNFLPVWCHSHPSIEKLINLFKTDNVIILRNLAVYIKKVKLIREEVLSF